MSVQTTISFVQAQATVQQQRIDYKARKAARLAAFQEFKSSFHDLLDTRDLEYYVEATGLALRTLLRFVRVAPPAPSRLFARAPQGGYFEPYNLEANTVVECAFQATMATQGLIAFLSKLNPGWTFRAADCLSTANLD